MGTLETLLTVSVIFWGLIFIYLVWINLRVKKLDEEIGRLEKK
jgi:CcmD family protein